MVHNAVVYGLITTVNAFVFLRRDNGGKLQLTRLIPATTTTPTILHMLFYMSHLCASTELLYETHLDGRYVSIARAPTDSSAAPRLPVPSIAPSRPSLGPTPSLPPRRSPRFQKDNLTDVVDDELRLYIDIRSPGTYLGCKGYKGVLDTGETVFAKLWDGWKHSSEEIDREVQIYRQLSGLGGTVPKMIAHGGWGFCHILLLEFVKVIPVDVDVDLYRPKNFRKLLSTTQSQQM
jgi:hypothetical protein